jgi:hypothetical protein
VNVWSRTGVPQVVSGLTTSAHGWNTLILALVQVIPVIVSVQPEFGQSGAPATGEAGGLVVTLNEALAFLTALSGTAAAAARPALSNVASVWTRDQAGRRPVFIP